MAAPCASYSHGEVWRGSEGLGFRGLGCFTGGLRVQSEFQSQSLRTAQAAELKLKSHGFSRVPKKIP